MALMKDDDCLLVGREGVDYRVSYTDFKNEVGDKAPTTWNDVVGKPSKYPPDTHSHNWNDISSKPSKYPPEDHTHPYMPLDLTTLPTL